MNYEAFLEESAADLYDRAPCGYLSFSLDGTILKINKTLLGWLKLSAEAVLRVKKIKSFLTPASQEIYEAHFIPLLKRQGEVKQIYVEFTDPNQEYFPALVNAQQLKDLEGKPQVIRATIFNLTEQKKHEAELLAAKQKAEEASKNKTDFIATLSHEIRSPLNAIVGVTTLLSKKQEPAQQAEFLEVLKYASESLLNLINDILDLSKIEAGRTELISKPFNIRQLVRQIGIIQNIKATEKGISVQVVLDDNLPQWLLGDETKIGQVLTNLVSNAVKFTQKGFVKLQLVVSGIQKNEYAILFKVTDTGIGIPPERINTIFEEFTQASNDTSQQYGGTGLGLTISKRILDLYGSKINVKSKPGEGTEFSFTLHLRKNGTPTPQPAGNLPKVTPNQDLLKGVKILLVEDSKVNIMVVEQYLKNWDIIFDTARNGLQAVSKINQSDFDVILMDLQLPVLDGYAATRWIRTLPHPKYQQLPIIAVSAASESGPDIKTAGLTDFLSKPFKPEELFAKIALYSGRVGQ